LNITLDVKTQVQELTITDSTPVVDQMKTGVSQVVDSSQIQNLPINGRRVDTFVLLTPGVTSDGAFGLVTFRGIPGGNAFLTDGNDTTQSFYNENAGRTRISANISQDAVQEFQVQSSGFSAEFGRSVGGSVNTVTRSGSNDVHGTAYWFFRNQNFNARDRYAFTNPDEKRNQFGGSFGGPVKKDKLFYFLNYDGTRRNFPLVSTITNPQLFDGSGNFIGACASPATPAQCSAAVNYFKRFFQVIPRTADQDAYFGKIDWRPNEANSISASFNLMNWLSPNGIQTQATRTDGGGIGNNGVSTVRHRFARIAHTGIVSPSLVNEFRFGWFKDRLYDAINEDLSPPNGLRAQMAVQGQGNLGIANFLPRVQPTEDRWQFANNITWLTGTHNFKFGFDIAHMRDITDALNNGRGSYTYGSVTDFARDFTNLDGGKRWQSYSQTFGDVLINTYVRDFNFFAQDQWKATSRLTLNYGIRYEYAQFSQPTRPNADYPLTGNVRQPGKNFAPRFGFAYTLDKAAKTVMRGSYGIFYARMPGSTLNSIFTSAGTLQKSISLQGTVASDRDIGPVFPFSLPSIDREPPAGVVRIGYAAADLRTPYTQQWDLGIERELTRDMGITLSYLGSRGIGFFMTRDLNIGALGPNVTYRINDTGGNQVGTYTTPTYLRANRVDPKYASVSIMENAGNTWYNAMVVQFRKRAGRWAQGTAAYTWSHAIDYNQGGGNDNLFIVSGSNRTLFNGDWRGQRATSDLDQRHRLVLTGLINTPNIKSDNAAAKYLANGWNLSVIATFASAPYTTPVVQVSGTPFTGAASNSTLNGFGGSAQVPWLSRSSIPVDNIARFDARLTKALQFTERYQLQLNFEAFNVFNHVSDTNVSTRAYQARTGVLTPIAGLGSGTASLGFPDGTNARRAQFSMRFIF
jgi:hypothetical protein